MSANRTLLSLTLLFGCIAGPRDGGLDPLPPAAVDGARPADLGALTPDLGYACAAYSAYQARTDGVVRSPCAYDVSKILSIGGDVKTRIRPPTITMEFPDGTTFNGETNGETFAATRTQRFPFEDGCQWQATETLRGRIDVLDECRLRATYSYREAPISAPPCAMACTIDAQVVISRSRILIE